MEEYKFSMERKDRVLDWSIGIFFVALVAYVELLRYQLPSLWRIYLLVGLLCFMVRLFSGSCLAYAYLRKWRYLLDQIEKHWMTNEVPLESVENDIKRYHYSPRTTERRMYFVKHQLVGGFGLLFIFPFFLLVFEILSNPPDLNIVVPISVLVAYYIYEYVILVTNKELSMPSGSAVTPTSNETEQVQNMEKKREHLDGLFEIALVLLGILSAAEFQYFLTVEDATKYFYALKVFTVPFIVLILIWLIKELAGFLLTAPAFKMILSDFCWDFWSFTLLYYLLGIYGGEQIGIWLSFVLSMVLIAVIQMAYIKVSPVTWGDRSMFKYYRSPFWIGLKIVAFVLAYGLLLRIVLP